MKKKRKLVLKFWVVETVGYILIVTGMWAIIWISLSK